MLDGILLLDRGDFLHMDSRNGVVVIDGDFINIYVVNTRMTVICHQEVDLSGRGGFKGETVFFGHMMVVAGSIHQSQNTFLGTDIGRAAAQGTVSGVQYGNPVFLDGQFGKAVIIDTGADVDKNADCQNTDIGTQDNEGAFYEGFIFGYGGNTQKNGKQAKRYNTK